MLFASLSVLLLAFVIYQLMSASNNDVYDFVLIGNGPTALTLALSAFERFDLVDFCSHLISGKRLCTILRYICWHTSKRGIARVSIVASDAGSARCRFVATASARGQIKQHSGVVFRHIDVSKRGPRPRSCAARAVAAQRAKLVICRRGRRRSRRIVASHAKKFHHTFACCVDGDSKRHANVAATRSCCKTRSCGLSVSFAATMRLFTVFTHRIIIPIISNECTINDSGDEAA